jgi:hyperosmotically inducible protein
VAEIELNTPGVSRASVESKEVFMGKFLQTLLPLVAVVWTLSACQALTGRTLGENIDDSNTTAAVKAQLAREKVSSLLRIDVDTTDGVVALNGTVESSEQKSRAEQIARGVSGVKSVVNNLQVQPR